MIKRVILFVMIGLILVWLGSLVYCEILTQAHFDDFAQAYQQNTMIGDIEYFKVLSCDGKKAEVYYVSENMTDANVLTFQQAGGNWNMVSWRTVWSDTGSASGVIYPYWWHFIYGGF